jgi:hypothetical protein
MPDRTYYFDVRRQDPYTMMNQGGYCFRRIMLFPGFTEQVRLEKAIQEQHNPCFRRRNKKMRPGKVHQNEKMSF